MQSTKTKESEPPALPLFEEDDDEGELDFEDLLKLGDEEAMPKPDT
jgi:hypothetical protein